MHLHKITSILFLFTSLVATAQNTFKFKPKTSIPAIVNGDTLELAWAGGMNAPQFNELDVNDDGFKDLIVFDRVSNSYQVFLNNGFANQTSYTYSWEYENAFPEEIKNFSILRDWNCDGREDLFTYSPGGLAVYDNVSTGDWPEWQLQTDYLRAKTTSGGVSGVYSLDVDYNVIDDIDGDGDLDFLAFGVFGTTVTLWENIADNCDTLNLLEHSDCWGNFYENSLTAQIILNQSCKGRGGAQRHSGSTMLTLDMDNDGDKELILGDVESHHLIMLTNGGTATSADMVSQDTIFPSNNIPVDLEEFIAPFYVDINNDGVKDFIAAPFDANIHKDRQNVWLYRNNGQTNQPSLNFAQEDFLVNKQIDMGTGAHPKFIDVDGDSLLDIVSGNLGYFIPGTEGDRLSQLAYYRNVGTATEPAFELQTEDYLGLSAENRTNLCPAFGDLNGDGATDMVVGSKSGTIAFYENQATAGNPMNLVLTDTSILDTVYNNIDLFPFLYDLNHDSVLDMLVGRRGGYISVWINKGTTTAPVFEATPDVDTLGGIQQGYIGFANYMHAEVAEIGGDTLLLIGDNAGYLKLYDGIEDYTAPSFTLVDSIRINGGMVATSVADIFDNDTNEILVGQMTGGLTIFYQADSVLTGVEDLAKHTSDQTEAFIFPNPNHAEFSLEGSAGNVLTVYDLMGKEIEHYYLYDGINTFSHQLSAGIYIVVETNDQNYVRSQKMIVQ